MKLARVLLTAAPVALAATTAHAVRQPEYLDERPLETADGARGRLLRPATSATPPAARPTFAQFLAAHGRWQALWDADTGVPTRLWGQGIAAPGAVDDPAAAERAVRDLLQRHVALLAPGAKPDDFELLASVRHLDGADRPMRAVVLAQRHRGLPVAGAALSFVFKRDRLVVIGSTASPWIGVEPPTTSLDLDGAAAKAAGWIQDVYGGTPKVLGTGSPEVLPVLRERADHAPALEHRVVLPVTVDLASPRGLWTVYLDAQTGAPVARRQRLAFAQGTVTYRVPVRYPGGARQDYPAAYTAHTVDGGAVTSDAAGVVSWASAVQATLVPGLRGPYARVFAATGTLATANLALPPDGTASWDRSSQEREDAQLTASIHATVAKRFAIDNFDDGSVAWLGQQLPVFVNEDDICNAYSNLDDIHFFVAGSTNGFSCENTARLADVVYHEFGHSLHGQSLIGDPNMFDGALSEGISDYLAATMTGDPAMGVGFFGDANPLRHIDPEGREYRWPEDQTGDPHGTGLIIAGALWDLRKALVADLGQAAGVAQADAIFYGVIRRSSDIPSSYAEALATDDDDGDLSNGTPNQCAIDTAWGAHGIAGGAAGARGQVRPPTVDGLTLSVAQLESDPGCPSATIASVQATWRRRGDAAVGGVVDLVEGAGGFAAAQPDQADGTVVQYQVTVTLDDGSTRMFPSNVADPWYELYVGPLQTVWCTDFETDPVAEGWTLSSDFQWGVPMPPAGSSDPAAAYSGERVLGTDLGGSTDGDYERNRREVATSPVIDVSGFTGVRLQYRRWLNVEDAFYDQASVLVDGQPAWTNAVGDENDHHTDREWRFHDVDLGAAAADGQVQLGFDLVSDAGLEYGGWNLDDVCIVAAGPPDDDGGGDDEPDPAVEDGGCCSTGGGGAPGAGLLAAATLLALGRRRRRR